MNIHDKILIVLTTISLLVIAVILIALPVMLLWNWLMPLIFDLKQINFLEALGLTALCTLLFKSGGSNEKTNT